jgi:peptidoglycan/xylan/chitin deacetylase (PgdA/CDA1 family)
LVARQVSHDIGMRCVILVSFDADLGLLAADPDAGQREKTLSTGRYGATRGLARVLRVLAEHTAPATWFIPTRNLDRYPTHAELLGSAFNDDGHELACAGEDLTDLTGRSLSDQVDIFTAARETLAAHYGVTPAGYRVPTGEPHPDLAAVLHQRGFDWSSCLRGDDLPYRHPGGLVEIPRHHELDDAAYFSFNLDPPIPAGSPRINAIGTVLQNWLTEFEAYHDERLCFTLDLHTELIGTPARCAMLSELLGHLRAAGDVEFCTAGQLAAWWTAEHPAGDTLPADHPLTVFRDGRRAHRGDTDQGAL